MCGVTFAHSTAEKHVCECQEEQGPSEVIEIRESKRVASLLNQE